MARLLQSLCIVSIAAAAQAQMVSSGTIEANWTRLGIGDPGIVLSIALQPGEGVDWIVGIRVNASSVDHVEVADCTPVDPLPASISGRPRSVPRLSGHPADQITISGSSINISGGASGKQVLVLYVELSHARMVSISDGIRPATSVNVSSGIVVGDGTVVQSSLEGIYELTPMALAGFARGGIPHGLSTNASPSVITRNNTNRVADVSSLRSHIVHHVEFESTPATGTPITVFARFSVTASGGVKNVSCSAATGITADVCGTITSTISKWTFQPFMVKGQPAEVSAVLPVFIAPSGEVTSMASPNFELRGH